MTYESHPIAELFPLIDGAELEELALDIARNGLRERIVTHEGKVLDGRNRLAACEKYGVTPLFRIWKQGIDGDTPQAFVVSRNLHRRHLSDAQRALVAAQLVTEGNNRHHPEQGVTIAQAGAMLNLSRKKVARARRVLKHGDKTIIGKVERGEITIGAAELEADFRTKPEPDKRPLDLQRPDGDRSLPEQIEDFLDVLRSRPREVAVLDRDQRVAFAKDFAVALRLMPDSEAKRSVTGSGLAAF